MEYLRMGASDLHVSRVGLGCNNFGSRIDLERTRAVVEAALECGITFFDTAEVYGGGGGSERMLGEILEGRRDEVVIATKFGWEPERGRGSADTVRSSIEGSLERLRTDHVDLYYLHRPDPETPIGETLEALAELVEEGKARALGCSNFSAEQLMEANRVADALGTPRFVAVQNEYSLLERRDDVGVLPLCCGEEIAYVPYFPLASGLLTGKYRRGEEAPEGTRLAGREIEDARLARVEALRAFAEARGRTILDLAIGSLASTPGISSIIAGATTPEQVRANAEAADWRLSADELAELARL
jgi:aryl-alcohol dehydrogenase-like predicted oxidoreductase